jgi:hypothetical protein
LQELIKQFVLIHEMAGGLFAMQMSMTMRPDERRTTKTTSRCRVPLGIANRIPSGSSEPGKKVDSYLLQKKRLVANNIPQPRI